MMHHETFNPPANHKIKDDFLYFKKGMYCNLRAKSTLQRKKIIAIHDFTGFPRFSVSFTTTVKGLQLRAIFQIIWLSLELFKDPLQPVLTFDPGLTTFRMRSPRSAQVCDVG